MVTVAYTETYDLRTTKSYMGMIGIHTPSASQIANLYSGLFDNYKYVRVKSCNVAMACASLLPADPLQVGTETGDIAPQDLFNPILYRAVSNDGMNQITSVVYGLTNKITNGTAGYSQDAFASATADQEQNMYYGLLADPSWRKAMPQSGLNMRGLYPMVYQVVNTFGNTIIPSSAGSLNSIGTVTETAVSGGNDQDSYSLDSKATTFRGPSMRMPRVPTWVGKTTSITNVFSGDPSSRVTLPTTYVAAIVLPPAKLHVLYYRLRVTWYIEFTSVCTIGEHRGFGALITQGVNTYASDYSVQSKSMDETSDTVDSRGMGLDKVMVAGE